MEGTSSGRTVVDIGETAKKHAAIVTQLLALHAITGCDTVAQLTGIGKITAIKTLLAGQSLKLLGEELTKKDIAEECTQFIAACYGSKIKNMSQHESKHGLVKWLNQGSQKHLNSKHYHQPQKHLNKMFKGHTSRQPSGNQQMSQIHLNLIQQSMAGHVMKPRNHLIL